MADRKSWAFPALARFDSHAFRQSRPVLMTGFVNTVGSIGLGLIPILLVERGASTAEGTVVLSLLKTMLVVGTLAGGALSDRISPRTLVLAALLLSAAGLGLLPFQTSIRLILFFGILAQSAGALLNVAQRILLMNQVDAVHQQEALGWMRMALNFAMIFSYALARAASRLGVAPLMLFDAGTSLAAFILGRKILPRGSRTEESPGPSSAGRKGQASKAVFFGYAVVLLGWAFFYELFMGGGAGRLEVLHPGEGLRRFSSIMILNTVLCAAFSVRASRYFRNPWTAISGGLLLTVAGIGVASWGMARQSWVFYGMFLITFGEVMLGAVSQYTLMRLTPDAKNSGFYYSLGLTLMQGGRIIGSALAFPLLIHADSLVGFTVLILAALAVLFCILLALKKSLLKLDDNGPRLPSLETSPAS